MRLDTEFFLRDVLDVAPDLLGCQIVRVFADNKVKKYKIVELEAYRGEEDLACHASKGRTGRTEIMYHKGGLVYVYLIYGMYWMLNIVCSVEGNPQAVLVRGLEAYEGPGKLSKELKIDGSFYGENLASSQRIWIEKNNDVELKFKSTARINIDYAGPVWSGKKWRFVLND